MRYLITICIASLVAVSVFAVDHVTAPKDAKTTEDIIKALEPNVVENGSLQTAQFSHEGCQAFAVWYCPFSGRASCYLHAYYYDYGKKRWILFADRFVDNNGDLSVEMSGYWLTLRGFDDGKIVIKESLSKLTLKKDDDGKK